MDLKEPIAVHVSTKSYKTAYSNYRGLSHLKSTYKMLSNILLSSLSPYAEEIIGDQ